MKKMEKNRKTLLPKLKSLMKELKLKHAEIDPRKCRILAHPDEVEKYADKLKTMNLVPAIVEEYPTWDALEVEIQFL